MADWNDLTRFVMGEYRLIDSTPDELRVLVEFEDDRSQVVIIRREVFDRREEWVQIASPCALAAQVNLDLLLRHVGASTVVGGIAIIDDHVVVRHTLPLENLDINEFTDPLALVAGAADELEERFVGGDGF